MSDIDIEDMKKMTKEEIEKLPFMEQLEIKSILESIEVKKIKNTTSQDLRTQILDHSIPMIKMIQDGIYNDVKFSNQQQHSLDRLWPVIESILQQTSDLQKIEAKNASDVIALVSKGKMTLKDAAQFMALLQTKVEIDELPKLLDQIAKLEGK